MSFVVYCPKQPSQGLIIRLEVPFADGLRSPRVPFAASPFPVAARLGALTKPLRGSRPRRPPGTVHLVEITFHYPFHIPSLSLLSPFKVHQEPNETSGNQPSILLSYVDALQFVPRLPAHLFRFLPPASHRLRAVKPHTSRSAPPIPPPLLVRPTLRWLLGLLLVVPLPSWQHISLPPSMSALLSGPCLL
jgi:hypothetical protein